METPAQFHEQGWARLPKAFSADAAAAMREAVWRALAEVGIERDDPSTWTIERPVNLQRLSEHTAFQAVSSATVRHAIAGLMDGQAYEPPQRSGALFLVFPGDRAWAIPAGGWHADARYTGALTPPGGVKTLALFGEVAPRSGGTLILSGSHRLVHRWFADHPPPAGARGAEMRKLLQGHPYIRDLHAKGDRDERIERFMGRAELHDGIPLQVVECAGAGGDVFLMHPLTLHVAAPNAGDAPRFMLSGGVTNDQWGWAAV